MLIADAPQKGKNMEAVIEVIKTLDWSPLWISLKTGIVATIFSFFLGIFAARKIVKASPGVKAVLDGILTLPMVLPPTVAGFFLLMIFGVKRPLGQLFLELFGVKIVFSWAATVIAAVAISFPLMYRAARGAFEQVDVTLIYAARTLGFSESRIFWKVILPSAMPGVLSGAILAFARGLGEFGATAMLAGNIAGKTQTLPLAIYSQVAAGKMSMAYQYVWIIVVISFLVVVLMNVLSRRDMRGSSNHKKKDNSVEAGGQDAKVSVELFADREADAQKGGAR